MDLTKKQQTYLVIAILILGALGGVYWKFVRPQLLEYKKVADDVAAKKDQLTQVLESYYNRRQPDEVIRTLEARLGPWQKELARAKQAYNRLEVRLPEGTKYPGYYFSAELKKVQKEVMDKAYAKNIYNLPPTLGFPEGIPPDESVEKMLNQLNATKFVAEFMIETEMVEMREFVVGEPITRDGFIQLFPYKVSFLTTMEDLVVFLQRVGSETQYLSARSVGFRSERYGPRTYVHAEVLLFTTRLLDQPVVEAVPEDEDSFYDDEEEW